MKDDVSNLDLNSFDPSETKLFQKDLWRPYFARLRQEAPVHYCSDSVYGPFWSVTTHELIKAVDTNHVDFSSAKGISIVEEQEMPTPGDMEVQNFISMDPPRHHEQRKSVAPATAPSNLANLEPIIRNRVAEILDGLPRGETFNWVDRVSIELTASMLAVLFNFPQVDRRKLVHWSDVATSATQFVGDDDLEEKMAATMAELQECGMAFYQLWFERQAQDPQFDLISMLVHSEATQNMHEDPGLFLGTILLLIVGGNDTTRNSISGGVLALNQFPEEYEKLRADHALIPSMVSEMVRWQTPVIHMRRQALRDVELGGQTIKQGDKVLMWYLSGNRDERVFEDADRFIVDRPNARQHLSFGFGVHRCMGNRLAEMQLRVLWEEIMARFNKIELVGDVERVPNNFIRGIKSVPVCVS